MSQTTADESFDRMLNIQEQLRTWQDSGLNEADTRAKILDRILKDVLGWDESSIRREVRTIDGEYVDYTLESHSNRLIAEAKKAGTYFEVPAGTSLRARRDGIITRSPALSKAIDQVVNYCKSKDVPVGVVSNGSQFAVTLVYKPAGNTYYDTLIFSGITRIIQQFTLFWNLLSPAANAEEELRAVLTSPEFIRPPPQSSRRLLDEVHLPDALMDRNPVDVSLAPIIHEYFSELVGPGKLHFLEKAYVESSRQAQYGKQIDAILSDQIPQIEKPVRPVETQKTRAPAFDLALDEGLSDSASGQPGSVLLLVGGVGAGKTTFLHRYFAFLMDDPLTSRVVPVYLDFTKTTEDVQDLNDFVDPEVLRLIQGDESLNLASWQILQQIYEREIATLRKGLLAPYWSTDQARFWNLVADELKELVNKSERHIARVIEYLQRHHRKQACIVFDNADQLGQEFQQRALKLAFQKCRTWGCLGILAIREETYWRFRNMPPLDAYHRYAYHISAPRMENVLSTRLALAKKEKGGQAITLTSKKGSLEFTSVSLSQFLEILVDSFLGEDRRNIILLEALSARDIRQGLGMFTTFLLSGHTNTDEYIAAYATSGSYIVPLHHVVRSIAFAERRYYDSNKSLIANLFSLEDDGFNSHFQKIRLLRYLSGLRDLDAVPGRGFVDVPRLSQVFRPVVSDEEGMRRVLDPLLRNRLIEAANGYRAEGEAADAVRLTPAGHYYLTTLLREFAYLDLVSTDTPIKSEKWFEAIRQEGMTGRSLDALIKPRTQKVGVFLDYLEEEERSELDYVRDTALPDHVTSPIVEPLKAAFSVQKDDIVRQAEKWGRDRPRG